MNMVEKELNANPCSVYTVYLFEQSNALLALSTPTPLDPFLFKINFEANAYIYTFWLTALRPSDAYMRR